MQRKSGLSRFKVEGQGTIVVVAFLRDVLAKFKISTSPAQPSPALPAMPAITSIIPHFQAKLLSFQDESYTS